VGRGGRRYRYPAVMGAHGRSDAALVRVKLVSAATDQPPLQRDHLGALIYEYVHRLVGHGAAEPRPSIVMDWVEIVRRPPTWARAPSCWNATGSVRSRTRRLVDPILGTGPAAVRRPGEVPRAVSVEYAIATTAL
jgi:hypothetical protein